LTWSAAMMAVPGGAGIAVSVAGTSRLLNEVFRTTPPVELRRTNGEKLKAMDVHPEVADAFLNNSVYSPASKRCFGGGDETTMQTRTTTTGQELHDIKAAYD
jgi:hypothetical protein